RLGDMRGLQVVTVAVLDVDDGYVRVFRFDLLDESVTALHTGGVDLAVADDSDLALSTDEFSHVIGGQSPSDLGVGGCEVERVVTVARGVELHDRDPSGLGCFIGRDAGLRVE